MQNFEKIGVLIADKEELRAFLQTAKTLFEESKTHSDGVIEFASEKSSVFVCLCGIGKVNAAIFSSVLILRYGCEIVINTGLSGGVQASPGEILVGKSFVEHDFDLTPLGYPLGKKPDEEKLEGGAFAEEIARELGFSFVNFGSGDCFVADSKRIELFVREFDEAACDMESAAAASACKALGAKFLSVRQISDGADENAADTYNEANVNQGGTLPSVVIKIIQKLSVK